MLKPDCDGYIIGKKIDGLRRIIFIGLVSVFINDGYFSISLLFMGDFQRHYFTVGLVQFRLYVISRTGMMHRKFPKDNIPMQ